MPMQATSRVAGSVPTTTAFSPDHPVAAPRAPLCG
jgi:hypothetical protein